jgi:uncharacterized membrane protein YczE
MLPLLSCPWVAAVYFLWMSIRYFATNAFSLFPALNFGTLFAAILSGLPVRGFLPVRADLFTTEKVPII